MRVALVASFALALANGPVGTLLLMRRESLGVNVLSHAVMPGAALGFLYAGDFMLNTGYDDPAGASNNLGAARELYSAQVFASSATLNKNAGGSASAEFRITAEPTLGSTITSAGSVTTVARVWLKCNVWIEPDFADNLDYVELTSVAWALYRI